MMAGKSKIDEDCEELSVVADPWNLKLKPAKLKGDPFSRRLNISVTAISKSVVRGERLAMTQKYSLLET
jgi:hypothetical protein